MCSHSVCSHTPTHLGSRVSSHGHTCSHSHSWPFLSPVLTHFQICLCTILLKCIPHKQSHTQASESHSLTNSYSNRAPTLPGSDPCGNTFGAFTRDTTPPPALASPIPGTPTAPAPPPCTPSHPTRQHIHSYTLAAAESATSGRPAPTTCAHLREVA